MRYSKPSWSVLLLLGLAVWVQQPSWADDLRVGFLHPPQPAKPSAYWLWLNGYTNLEHMTEEIAAFADMGVGGLCIFDMGARGTKHTPPAGAAFLSDESLEAIAHAVRTAKKQGLHIQLAACSSWDLGASWVTPDQASMALYRSELVVSGPNEVDLRLPTPALPRSVPRDADGKPLVWKEVALLAVPHHRRQPGHDFIFELPRADIHRVSRVVLKNTTAGEEFGPKQLFAKDFTVAVSMRGSEAADFREVLAGTLEASTTPQAFEIEETQARLVRLRILNGHNVDHPQVQLGEFEVYSPDNVNLVAGHEAERTRDNARLVWFNSQSQEAGRWEAANLNDGQLQGARGSWRSAGPPPLWVDDPASIINLSNAMGDDGTLRWEVPAGKWTLMRFVCGNTGERLKVPSPNSDGLATDHFSAAATEEYIRTLTSRLEAKLGNPAEAGISEIYLPSYEVRNAKWTPDFLEQFRAYRGYDMTPYLPTLSGCLIENEERTRRFQYDLEKTLGDLLVDAYYRTASKTAHAAGLGIEAEAGGPGPPVHQVPVDALKALGAIDEMRGEFWPWRMESGQLWVVKETACAAHIYGRRRVHMESFTGFRHWEDGPFELKPSADRAFCEGMNHVVWHTASHQPPEAGKPGWVYGAGTHLTPNLVWWPLGKPFIDYLARCSFLLQQGLFVGDVCYYYGDQGSNFVPPKRVDPSLGYGFDYDVVNSEVILTRMSVEKGRFMLPDGMTYEMLVLPERDDFDLQTLQKIERLIQAGGTVVGPKPTRANGLTDYPHRDRQVAALADRIWGDCDGKSVLEHRYGKGRVVWGKTLANVLDERDIGPDFSFVGEQEDAKLDYIHRRTPEADIYFVRNAGTRSESVLATFRVKDRLPELWSPESEEIREVAAFESTAEGTRFRLSLTPSGSVFVVFRKPVPEKHLRPSQNNLHIQPETEDRLRITASEGGVYRLPTNTRETISVEFPNLPEPKPVLGPWTIHFPEGRGAPATLTVNELRSWTKHQERGVKHFSGIARYQTSFKVPPEWLTVDRKVLLDLGRLWAVGQVRVNGKLLGVLWQPPYQIDITEAAIPGENRLEVEVANTWANRLVGDAQLPEDQQVSETNITVSGSRPWQEVPLHEAGLLGPVRLVPAQQKVVLLAE